MKTIHPPDGGNEQSSDGYPYKPDNRGVSLSKSSIDDTGLRQTENNYNPKAYQPYESSSCLIHLPGILRRNRHAVVVHVGAAIEPAKQEPYRYTDSG